MHREAASMVWRKRGLGRSLRPSTASLDPRRGVVLEGKFRFVHMLEFRQTPECIWRSGFAPSTPCADLISFAMSHAPSWHFRTVTTCTRHWYTRHQLSCLSC
jgi:hypothetical protein